MEDWAMTDALKHLCGDRFPATPRNPSICYRCDCGFRSCYKVMQLRTVQKPSPRSRFLCPAHQTECSTHSKYAKLFAEEVLKIDSSAAIVWDWHCVPKNKFMSIDATVVHGDKCTSFELDGPQHFTERECSRNAADEKKDMLLMKAGWGVMRLHHKDKDEWHQYINHMMHGAGNKVVCTASYMTYLTGDHGEPTLIKAGKQ